MLVYLALASTGGFVRRDILLPVFWPELPESRARNALRQGLHQLRQALGPDVIVTRGADELTVDQDLLWCDAVALQAALDRGTSSEAVSLYGGDLLRGFALDNAPEFERWLEDTRAEFREGVGRAAWALADEYAAVGRVGEAVESARRAVSIAVDEEHDTRRMMSLLDRVGDRTAALRVFDDFSRRLRRDLDAEPAGEIRSLAQAIRARSSPPPEGAVVLSSTATAPPEPGSRRRTVVVQPLENQTGDPSLDYVGRLVADAIVQGMTETHLVDVVASSSGQTDVIAGHIRIGGSYSLRENGWSFRATVTDAEGGKILGSSADVAAARERPWEAAEQLRQRLGGILASHLDPHFAMWANAVSHPPTLEAHGALVVGVDLHLRGEFAAALPHLLQAAGPDAGFTMPLIWALQASCNLEEWDRAESLLGQLLPRRTRLAPFEQTAVDYFAACLNGDRGGALRAARRAVELAPNSEALTQLGREALLCNHPRLAVEALERADPTRGWIPAWIPYWQRLTEAYHLIGEHSRELAAARRARQQHPVALSAVWYEARAHAALGDIAATRACVDEAMGLSADRFADGGEVLLSIAHELHAHGHREAGEAIAEQATLWAGERLQDGAVSRARFLHGRACYAARRWPDARIDFEQLHAAEPDNVSYVSWLAAAAARDGDTASALSAVAELRAKTGRYQFGKHLAGAARALAVLGDHDEAVNQLRRAFARGFSHEIALHSDPDLALLGNHPGFRELMRPKG